MEDKLETVVQELQSTEFLNIVRTFLEFLKSCFGPRGGIKILVSSGGISFVSSSSSRVLNNHIISHPLCTFVSQVMNSQTMMFGDNGLYTGILTMSLLERSLKESEITQSQTQHLIQGLSSQIHYLLEMNSIKLKLDFSTVTQFLPIVKAILSSKPSCGLNNKELEKLSVQIIKVFLNTINDDFGDIMIMNVNDLLETTVLNGILYQIDIEEKFVQDFVEVVTDKLQKKIPLLLFDIMLTDTKNELEEVTEEGCTLLKEAVFVFECAVKIGVKIIACQKVVHQSLRLLLQRNGILLMDRLGSELCGTVEKMSGAKPISSLKNTTVKTLRSCLGSVDSVKFIRFGSKPFVVLEKNSTNTASLLLCCSNEEAFVELKLITRQALKALRQVTCQPFVLPGAGCLEMWLATQLRVQDTSDPAKRVLEKTAIGWLQKSFITISALLETSDKCMAADTAYCHNWNSWDPDLSSSCRCGLVKADDVKAAGGSWVQPNQFSINDLVFPLPNQFNKHPLHPNRIHEAAVVDVHISKRNAIKLALETCVNILSIGFVVYKSPINF
ncbi:hypothetical protein R5R35_000614 [Gryllus longicercus]|uniref:Uncharacterized protein n=1 Tax=Gryllus longicercus TaxID=2509291 RepID=A0AAN9VND2_9ORTH